MNGTGEKPPMSAGEREAGQRKLAKSVYDRKEAILGALFGDELLEANREYSEYYDKLMNDYGEKVYNVATFQGIDHDGVLTSKKVEADDFASKDSVVKFLDRLEEKYKK